jgi:hypothetical protein
MGLSAAEQRFRDELIKETGDLFHTYVGKGVRVPGPTTLDINEWDDSIPSLNISDLRQVLRVHFILTGHGESALTGELSGPGVIPFMEALPERIRRLKPSIVTRKEVVSGGIKGRVDWKETVDLYRQQGYIDRSRYVCTDYEDDFQTVGVRLVHELLTIIRSIFEDELAEAVSAPHDYEWLDEWLADGSEPALKSVLDDALDHHPIMREVSTWEDRDMSMKAIQSAKHSRSQLYQEAAVLLEQYRNLIGDHDFDATEAQSILRNAYIRPDSNDGAKLFELYWIFRLLQSFEAPRMNAVDSRTNQVAQWTEDRKDYELYHTGGQDNLEFSINLSEVESEIEAADIDTGGYLQRQFDTQQRAVEYAREAFGTNPQETAWSGTPDILLFESDTGSEEWQRVLIGEVKYSDTTSYLKRGIQELLEYIHLATEEGSYISDGVGVLGETSNRVEGVLFTKELGMDIDNSQLPISIIQYGESHTPFAGSDTTANGQ